MSKSKYIGKYFEDTRHGDYIIFKVIGYSRGISPYLGKLEGNPRFQNEHFGYDIKYLHMSEPYSKFIGSNDRYFRREINKCKRISKDKALIEVL